MEYVTKTRDACVTVYKVAAKDPPRTLRFLSTLSGVLLILGGFFGIFTINPLAMVISIYIMLFGVLIVLTELKTWPIIRTFQKKVDVYFHLLSVPRGKGGFYCFIGFLAFFSTDWSIVRVFLFIVSVVGMLHLFACKRCGADIDPNGDDPNATLPSARQLQEIEPAGADPGTSTWQGLMKEVVADNPEVLSMGLQAAASSAVGSAMSSMSGSSADGSGDNGSGSRGGATGVGPGGVGGEHKMDE